MPDTPPSRVVPLGNLRAILGDAEGPIGQEKFAAMVGVAVSTLRAIERGSRSMTAHSLAKIHRQTGATWNEDSETWTYDQTGRPFTWKTYQQYRTKLPGMPDPEWYLEQFRSHAGTIHDLFKDCPAQKWKALSLAIGDALAEVRKAIRGH
jgi:transcriptional regulator with XRE-family HTH domain